MILDNKVSITIINKRLSLKCLLKHLKFTKNATQKQQILICSVPVQGFQIEIK